MAVQKQLFPEPQRTVPGAPASAGMHPRAGLPGNDASGAPIWLQRVSLFVLVLFCIYLGVLVTVLPWWTRVWDHNMFLAARPNLALLMHNGYVRGIISGLGLLDIWIGISEAIHYRDYKD
jgi:hypothetical protein